MTTSNTNNDKKDDTKSADILNSEYHTVFKKHVDESKKTITVEGKEYVKIKGAHTLYRLFIDAFGENSRGLHEMFNILWDASNNDKLELRIHSYGGSVHEGEQFYNLIKNKFNGRTTTILDSCAYSMGALIFLSGDKRVVMEHCDLMLHDFSTVQFGKAGEVESCFEHRRKSITRFFKKIVMDEKFLTDEEFNQMLTGKDFWMDVVELCERGIATHVMVKGETIKASKYLKLLHPKSKKNNQKKDN